MQIYKENASGTEQNYLPELDTVFFELTNRCNFNCNFCPISVSERPAQKMDFNMYKKAIDEIAEKKIAPRVGFHILGEPLLYEHLGDAVRYAHDKGLSTGLSTNGSLLEGRILESLRTSGLDTLSISLETTDAAEHDTRGASMGFSEYFDRILNAIRVLEQDKSMIITLTMMNTVTRKLFGIEPARGVNIKETRFTDKLVRLAAEILRVTGRSYSEHEIWERLASVNLNTSQNIWVTEKIKIYVQLLMDWGNAFTEKRVHPVTLGYCGYALNRIGILADGTVTLCCGDFDGKTGLGNITSGSLADILVSRQANQVMEGFARNRVIHPYCRRCLGAPSRIRALIKGLVSIYLFRKKSHPLNAKDVYL